MKKALFLAILGLSSAALATTWNNVPLIDKQCERKVASNPDAHTRNCALQCSKSGYGIVTNDGKFLKFDSAGDEQALSLLKQTDKKDHLRVTVDGEEKDGTIQVKSMKFD